jgi:chromosome segregation ATPase
MILAGVLVVVIGILAYRFAGFGDGGDESTAVATGDASNSSTGSGAATKKKNGGEDAAEAAERAAELKRDQQREMEQKKLDLEAKKLQQQQDAAETQRRMKEELDARHTAEREAVRLKNSLRRLQQLKTVMESDLGKFEVEFNKVDAEFLKQYQVFENAAKERVNEEKLREERTDRIEKAHRSEIAAKNQIALNEKKLEELRVQLQAMSRNAGASQEMRGQIERKQQDLRAAVANFKTTMSAAAQAQNEPEIAASDYGVKRAEAMIKDLQGRREKLEKRSGETVANLEALRKDADFPEFMKTGADEEIQKTAAKIRKLIAQGPPARPSAESVAQHNDTRAPSTPAPTATTDSTDGSPGVTVADKKDPVTVYTLKDGKKIEAVKTIDAGDMISVKTVGGEFKSILKEEIAKKEVNE